MESLDEIKSNKENVNPGPEQLLCNTTIWNSSVEHKTSAFYRTKKNLKLIRKKRLTRNYMMGRNTQHII